MKYHFKIHKEQNGLWARCVEFEGCVTQADSAKDLHHNIKEVLSLFLESDKRCCTCGLFRFNGCNLCNIIQNPFVINDCKSYRRKKLNLKIIDKKLGVK